MKRGAWAQAVFIFFFVLWNALWGVLPEAQEAGQDITARQIRSLMSSGTGYAFALQSMSDFYRDRLNNGESPDEELRIGLGDLFSDYLSENPRYLDLQAAELFALAFKEVHSLIEEQKAIWSGALNAAKAYYSTMSPELAKAFFEALPDHRLPRLAFDQEVLVIRVASSDRNMSELKEKLEAGEPAAVNVGFRLIYISDGAFAEELFHVLGEILPKHPRLFLEKAAAHLGRKNREDSDWILDHLVLDLIAWWEMPEDDDEKGTKRLALEEKERELRIKALKSVEDDGLRTIRDRCLALLTAKEH